MNIDHRSGKSWKNQFCHLIYTDLPNCKPYDCLIDAYESVILSGMKELNKPITPSKLREDIYNILDAVLEKGKVVEVKRKGQIIKIVPPLKPGKLDRLEPHPNVVAGDSEDLVSLDWSKTWKPSI